jgi:hypothetical protein
MADFDDLRAVFGDDLDKAAQEDAERTEEIAHRIGKMFLPLDIATHESWLRSQEQDLSKALREGAKRSEEISYEICKVLSPLVAETHESWLQSMEQGQEAVESEDEWDEEQPLDDDEGDEWGDN